MDRVISRLPEIFGALGMTSLSVGLGIAFNGEGHSVVIYLIFAAVSTTFFIAALTALLSGRGRHGLVFEGLRDSEIYCPAEVAENLEIRNSEGLKIFIAQRRGALRGH
jgi:hypothetical protein